MVLSLRLESLFPAMATDLAFDFSKGTHRGEDGVLATVVGVRSEQLRQAQRDLRDSGCIAAWVAPVALGAVAVAKSAGHDDAIVVESSGGQLCLDIVRHGSLVFSRSAVDGGTVESRHSEVLRTLAAFGLHSAALIAVKGTDLGNDVKEVEQGTLEAMSRHSAEHFDIELPEDIAQRAKSRTGLRTRIAATLWAAVLVVAAYVYFERDDMARSYAKSQQSQQRERDDARKQMNEVASLVSTAEKNESTLGIAFVPSQPVTDVLTLVSNTLPSSAWLTGVTFERGKDLQIRGTAIHGEAVSNYVSELALNSRLRDVTLQFANNTEIEATPVVQFSVTAHVVGNFPLVEKTTKRGGTR